MKNIWEISDTLVCEVSLVFYVMSLCVRKPTIWVPNMSDTNRAVKAQKQARSLKFRIQILEEMYYPCSENKGADQLRGYREADLRLCFCLCRLLVFPRGGSNKYTVVKIVRENPSTLFGLPVCCNTSIIVHERTRASVVTWSVKSRSHCAYDRLRSLYDCLNINLGVITL